MSIVHGTPKNLLISAGMKINCWLNQQKRGSFICTYIAVSFLVFITKYLAFPFLEN